jgi:hypothetical protein
VISAHARARLALVVLLSELFLVLAGSSGVRHPVHRATVDAVVTAHATAARLPKTGDARAHRADARETSSVLPTTTPFVARASWVRASFVHAAKHAVFTATHEPRARGPPDSA